MAIGVPRPIVALVSKGLELVLRSGVFLYSIGAYVARIVFRIEKGFSLYSQSVRFLHHPMIY